MGNTPKTLMDAHQLDPKKSLGQNFLQDENTLLKITQAAEIPPNALILEIGPGTGALTRIMHREHPDAEIVCVEIDQRLQPILRGEFAGVPQVRFVWDDILKVDVRSIVGDRAYFVVANVPYYISSAILKHLLQDTSPRPSRLVMTVQYELAERICQPPGDLSLLAVSVQFYGQPRLVHKVASGAFWPRPDVDSAVLRVDTYPTLPVDVPSEGLFFRVVKAGFSQKRKQLRNALSGGLALNAKLAGELIVAAGIDPARRAETLILEEWAALTREYAAHQQP